MRKTYYIIVIGCQMNKSDSERIASYLDDLGYSATENKKEASLVIITTCGIRQSAEDRIYGFVPRIKKENQQAKIVITGCLSERKDVIKRLGMLVDIWLPIKSLPSFAEKLGVVEKKNPDADYLRIKPKQESKFSALVPIGNGCNNFCTYCVVPYARGREVYRDHQEIYNEVKYLVEQGYKEILLIAQNVNSYKCQSTHEMDFAGLLKSLNDIKGDFWLRFLTSHPKDMSDDLIDVMATCDKVCAHTHLPAQAGDNEILQRMNRKYTREHYLALSEKIREKIVFSNSKNTNTWRPPVSITTDIIVGFPGESREQFENTKELCERVGYDIAYVSEYSPRPGTEAEKFIDDVTREEKKRREDELLAILLRSNVKNNQVYIGKTVKVLVEAINKNGLLVGKTETSKVVKIRGLEGKEGEGLVGQFVRVKIGEMADSSFLGEKC